MHTLNALHGGMYDVVFVYPNSSSVFVARGLTYDNAMSLVNYLNGGTGQPIGEPIVVAKTSLF